MDAAVITGSSNLTGYGLGIGNDRQYEFNVLLNNNADVSFAKDVEEFPKVQKPVKIEYHWDENLSQLLVAHNCLEQIIEMANHYNSYFLDEQKNKPLEMPCIILSESFN